MKEILLTLVFFSSSAFSLDLTPGIYSCTDKDKKDPRTTYYKIVSNSDYHEIHGCHTYSEITKIREFSPAIIIPRSNNTNWTKNDIEVGLWDFYDDTKVKLRESKNKLKFSAKYPTPSKINWFIKIFAKNYLKLSIEMNSETSFTIHEKGQELMWHLFFEAYFTDSYNIKKMCHLQQYI